MGYSFHFIENFVLRPRIINTSILPNLAGLEFSKRNDCATGWLVWVLDPGWAKKLSSSLKKKKKINTGSGSNSVPYSVGIGVLSWGQLTGVWIWPLSPPSSDVGKNKWRCNSTPRMCPLGVDRNIFTISPAHLERVTPFVSTILSFDKNKTVQWDTPLWDAHLLASRNVNS